MGSSKKRAGKSGAAEQAYYSQQPAPASSNYYQPSYSGTELAAPTQDPTPTPDTDPQEATQPAPPPHNNPEREKEYCGDSMCDWIACIVIVSIGVIVFICITLWLFLGDHRGIAKQCPKGQTACLCPRRDDSGIWERRYRPPATPPPTTTPSPPVLCCC